MVSIAIILIMVLGSLVGVKLLSNKDKEETTSITESFDEELESQVYPEIEDSENPVLAEAEDEVSFYDSVAIAQVDTYVNVRSGPGTDYEIVGIIRNDQAATIIGEEDGWYNIESGNVEGYILAEYFLTGDEAEVKAREVGYVYAKVTADVLNVRKEQSTDSQVIGSLMKDKKYDVIKYGDGWVYLKIDDSLKGWVTMEYVEIDVKFETALTLEEEAERVAEEEQEKSTTNSNQSSKSYNYSYEETSDKAELRAQVVAFALQFEGNPYVSGGRSLITGTDCSGFTSLVYANFGYSLSPASAVQPTQGVQVPASLDSLLPGDILYRGIEHVALYIGNGKVIHASSPSVGIVVWDWNYHSRGWTGAIRIIY